MRTNKVVWLLVPVFLLAIDVPSQDYDLAHPRDMTVQHHQTPEEIRDRLLGPQLQKDAKELSDVCASIPADMDGIRQGLLGKDVMDKLKRVEKLSKRVRDELARSSASLKDAK